MFTTEEQEKFAVSSFKRSARIQAIQTALSMQPTNYNAQTGLANNSKSVTSLISDANKIYDWLIKDL